MVFNFEYVRPECLPTLGCSLVISIDGSILYGADRTVYQVVQNGRNAWFERDGRQYVVSVSRFWDFCFRRKYHIFTFARHFPIFSLPVSARHAGNFCGGLDHGH